MAKRFSLRFSPAVTVELKVEQCTSSVNRFIPADPQVTRSFMEQFQFSHHMYMYDSKRTACSAVARSQIHLALAFGGLRLSYEYHEQMDVRGAGSGALGQTIAMHLTNETDAHTATPGPVRVDSRALILREPVV